MKTAVIHVTVWIAICILYCTGDRIATSETTVKGTPQVNNKPLRRGPQGEKGEQRLQGRRGKRGPAGPQGPAGVQGPPGGGATYTRWGRTVCPQTAGTVLVYHGLAAGGWHDNSGGGANYLCITQQPEYLSKTVPSRTAISFLFGAEYEAPVFGGLQDENVPCAVCYTSQRSAKIVIPGKTSCPTTWTEEYEGYLMAERQGNARNTVYECVDKDGEAVPGEGKNTGGALFYHVGALCNVGLPCPPFIELTPIACVVCTK